MLYPSLEEKPMSQTEKLQSPAPVANPPYRRVYAWVFQAWLVMFLGVICVALIFYLMSYIPRT